MQRGNLAIYDNSGKIWYQSGEAEGDISPNKTPDGLPYIEIPFGTMAIKQLISIDVTDQSNPSPVFEDIIVPPTYEDLETQLLIAQGVI